jgi:hypothetical protein
MLIYQLHFLSFLQGTMAQKECTFEARDQESFDVHVGKFNDLKGYDRVTAEVVAAVGKQIMRKRRKSSTNTCRLLVMVSESLIADVCGWGSIVRKSNSRTTNHYLNLTISRKLKESKPNEEKVRSNTLTLENIYY